MIDPFVWYRFNINYNIQGGIYDIQIFQEGDDQAVTYLHGMVNASNKPRSNVYMFSFIGDREDYSNVIYYIDDISISSIIMGNLVPLAAPGHRRLFVDYWKYWQKLDRKKPSCLPFTSMNDFGISKIDLATWKQSGLLKEYMNIFSLRGLRISRQVVKDLRNKPLLKSVSLWRLGCHAMNEGKYKIAGNFFSSAKKLSPLAKLYELSYVLSLAGQRRFLLRVLHLLPYYCHL